MSHEHAERGGFTPAPSRPRRDERRRAGPMGAPALRLGTLFGIEIGVDWSWLFIFGLITLSLARGFAEQHEGWGSAAAWSAALLASLLFFSSILLHELGHSLTAQALGVRVRSITLFIFGGLARLSGEPKRPRDEFLIAAAGPAVSVALGALFLGLAALTGERGEPARVLPTVARWLGTVNLVLALFNLVPGFPLDGGRLMRALVWRVTGSFEQATYAAGLLGAAFAYVLIGTGIVVALLFGAFLNGLWLAFIGWFLLSAAQGSTAQMTLERQLRRVPLKPAMEPLEPRVDGDASVASVLESIVLGRGERRCFVEDHGRPTGMVTLHQLKRVPAQERATTPLRAIQLGRGELVTIPEEAHLWAALVAMNEHGVSQLPVERDGELVGVLTRERLVAIVQNVRELERRR